MPSSQPYGVSCKGGLNTNLNEFELLSTPGSASQLVNFEVDPDGGYRRINGFTPLNVSTSAVTSVYNNTRVEHFSGGQPNSAIYLTIESISPTELQVVVESADSTPVDLLVPEMTNPQYSQPGGAVVTHSGGVFTLTYTFDTAPSQVTLANVVWSKQGVAGNWQLMPNPYSIVLDFSASPGRLAGTPILGMQVYADGVIVATGTNLFFTTDGTSLLKINRSNVPQSGNNYADFAAQPLLARTNQDPEFIYFEDNTEYGKVIITDGSNKPFHFYMTGSGALNTRRFYVEQITVDGLLAPKVGAFHKRNFVCGGAPTAPNNLYYSGTQSFTTFTGGQLLALDDQIVSIKSFRDDLIVFCTNSLYKIVNLNDPSTLQAIPITKNVGCLSSKSVQEIGGDLVFLSPDGIRTVAGTARIGDVELSSVSRQIQSIFSKLTTDITDYKISSCVIRAKSQYRLFYHKAGDATSDTKGIIGTLTANGFEWSETRGIEATALTSGFNSLNVEIAYHGDDSGYVYLHDQGPSFHADGTAFNISARYKTPNFDFGDIGTKKTLDYVKISVTPEGVVEPTLDVVYDYGSAKVPQPPTYQLENIKAPGVFGTSKFTDPPGIASHFGGAIDPIIEQPVSGSGETVSFTIKSNDLNAPYSINGIYINYVPSSRR